MDFETYLRNNGFKEKAIECTCPHCVTVGMFLNEHRTGTYILICVDNIVPVLDGVCLDSEEALEEIVVYYYEGANNVSE